VVGNPSSEHSERELRAITGMALLALLGWTLVVGGSILWNLWYERQEHRALAEIEISLGVPQEHIAGHMEADRQLLTGLGLTHGVIWLLGAGMIGFARSRARRHVLEWRDDSQRRRLSAQVFDQTAEGIVITDTERRIISVNRAFTEITGYPAEEVLGRDPKLLQSGRHDGEFYRQLWQQLEDEGLWRGEIWNRRKNGELYPEWLAINVVRDADGRPEHYIGIFSDISRQKRDAERIRFLAYYDALTGLPNRTLLADRVGKAIAAAKRHQKRLALLFMDLDGFKHINDSLGHLAGDNVLRLVGERLKRLTRSSDTLARFGGDEFVLLLNDVAGPEGIAAVARRCVDSLAEPLELDGQEIRITPSIGISVCPNDGDTLDTLVKNADTAMYHAKAAGRNQYRFFEAEMNARVISRAKLGNALRRAIEGGELLLHYQPQADIVTGEIVGLEALVRWQHPELGLVSPADFVPVAEELGLIGLLGDWVLNETCRQAVAWQRAGLPHLPVAVNLSALQLRSPTFLQDVRQALATSGLDAHWLEFELTESVLMEQAETAVQALSGLGELGIRVAIDDFGTGYSSLAYLRRLAIDKIKIDRSFVRDLGVDAEDTVIVSTIIRMAHSLKLRVIAEGVETSEQLATLRAHGCDEIQGYYLSRPLPPDTLADFVQERCAA